MHPFLQAFPTRFPRLWRFASARFARGEYLGLHLTVGFAVVVATAWLFASLTEGVLDAEEITRIDLAARVWLQARIDPAGIAGWDLVSTLGAPGFVAAAWGAGALVLWRARRWVVAAGWTAALVGGGLLNLALKDVVRRARPADADLFLVGHSWSFPSGHAMGSLLCYGMLAYLLLVYRHPSPWLRPVIVAGAVALVLLVGVSRVCLGVHYVSDVLAGWTAGALWLAACVSGLEISRRMPQAGSQPEAPR